MNVKLCCAWIRKKVPRCSSLLSTISFIKLALLHVASTSVETNASCLLAFPTSARPFCLKVKSTLVLLFFFWIPLQASITKQHLPVCTVVFCPLWIPVMHSFVCFFSLCSDGFDLFLCLLHFFPSQTGCHTRLASPPPSTPWESSTPAPRSRLLWPTPW